MQIYSQAPIIVYRVTFIHSKALDYLGFSLGVFKFSVPKMCQVSPQQIANLFHTM